MSSNPNVFFDVSIGDAPAGRIVMELFADQVPKVRISPSMPRHQKLSIGLRADLNDVDRRELPRPLHW
jgi:hypothetical protein